MTLRMYADHKEWDLEEVEVRLEHGKVHAEDDERACRGEEGSDKVDRLERVLRTEGDRSDEQRERLAEREAELRSLVSGPVADLNARLEEAGVGAVATDVP
jgi:uncharacterized OsmC-like protein